MSDLFSTLTTNEIYFGPQGFQLIVSAEDRALVTKEFIERSEQPSWNKNWEVIALDTELGDPYIVDAKLINSAVYTAIFTGEEWELILVADSIDSFTQCITELQRVHSQTEPQFVPDEFSFQNNQQFKTLTDELIKLSSCQEFWQNFADCYIDWLEEE